MIEKLLLHFPYMNQIILAAYWFDAFGFQLKFNLKYTNFVLKENYFFVLIYTKHSLIAFSKITFI